MSQRKDLENRLRFVYRQPSLCQAHENSNREFEVFIRAQARVPGKEGWDGIVSLSGSPLARGKRERQKKVRTLAMETAHTVSEFRLVFSRVNSVRHKRLEGRTLTRDSNSEFTSRVSKLPTFPLLGF